MPRRRRTQEIRRAIRREMRREDAENARREREMAYLWADPLSDLFWSERQGFGPHGPDDYCYFFCPHMSHLENAREEIDQFRASERDA